MLGLERFLRPHPAAPVSEATDTSQVVCQPNNCNAYLHSWSAKRRRIVKHVALLRQNPIRCNARCGV